MTANPIIFDRALSRLRRERAAKRFATHDFLMRRAAVEAVSRLSEIMRTFAVAADLGSATGLFADAARGLPAGKIGWLVSVDAALAMAGQAPRPSVVANEDVLPFADASLSLIVSLLALHRVNDLPGALIQIRRALAADGLFLGALFGGDTLKELREVLTAAELETTGGASPRVAPFADVRDLGGLLVRAGFALPVADVDRVRVTFADGLSLMRDLRGMAETNSLAEQRRAPLRRDTLARAGELYAGRYGTPDGRISATFDIVYVTGWAPHASQQQPLRPGSARARLADALGTEERAAGDKANPRTKG